ncbi:MAG: energy transducer TonB [Magnetococcales bacterium]|nr:energy transducer TonB [Magnetococcales bacterium]
MMCNGNIRKALALSLSLHLLTVLGLAQGNRPALLAASHAFVQFEMVASPMPTHTSPAPLSSSAPTDPPSDPPSQERETPQDADEKADPAMAQAERPVPPAETKEQAVPSPVKSHKPPKKPPTVAQKANKTAKPPAPRPAQVRETHEAASPVTSQDGMQSDSASASLGSENNDRPPDLQAAYTHNPKPGYPSAAQRMGHEGTVLLSVSITKTGDVEQVSVQSSSGYESLDRAALTAVSGWKFIPARRNGLAAAARVALPIRFYLQK